MTDKHEYISNCCGTPMEMERGHCPSCGEGCEVLKMYFNYNSEWLNETNMTNKTNVQPLHKETMTLDQIIAFLCDGDANSRWRELVTVEALMKWYS